MKVEIEELLDERLDRLRRCEAFIGSTTEPDLQHDLAELIETAELIRGLPRPGLSPRAARRIERRLLQRASELRADVDERQEEVVGLRVLPVAPRQRAWYARRLVGLAATIILALAVMGAGTVMVSADSLPTSPLYRFKIAGERAQMMMAQSATARARVRVLMAEHRLAEIEVMVARGEQAPEGVIRVLQQEIDSALEEIEDSPSQSALGLLGQLSSVITRQKAVLQAVLTLVPVVARQQLETTVEAADKGQVRAAEAFARTLREQPELLSPTPTPTATPSATTPSTSAPAFSPSSFEPSTRGVMVATVPEPAVRDGDEVDGVIQAMAGGIWIVSGRRILVDARAAIKGVVPTVGARVAAHVIRLPDGTLVATEVEVEANAPEGSQPTASPTPVLSDITRPSLEEDTERRTPGEGRRIEDTKAPSPTPTPRHRGDEDDRSMPTPTRDSRDARATRTPSPTTQSPTRTPSPTPTAGREDKDKDDHLTPAPTRESRTTQAPSPTFKPPTSTPSLAPTARADYDEERVSTPMPTRESRATQAPTPTPKSPTSTPSPAPTARAEDDEEHVSTPVPTREPRATQATPTAERSVAITPTPTPSKY